MAAMPKQMMAANKKNCLMVIPPVPNSITEKGGKGKNNLRLCRALREGKGKPMVDPMLFGREDKLFGLRPRFIFTLLVCLADSKLKIVLI